jgi:hypothetical protein
MACVLAQNGFCLSVECFISGLVSTLTLAGKLNYQLPRSFETIRCAKCAQTAEAKTQVVPASRVSWFGGLECVLSPGLCRCCIRAHPYMRAHTHACIEEGLESGPVIKQMHTRDMREQASTQWWMDANTRTIAYTHRIMCLESGVAGCEEVPEKVPAMEIQRPTERRCITGYVRAPE